MAATLLRVFLLLLGIVLVACGGSSGGGKSRHSSSSNSNTSSIAAQDVNLSGKVTYDYVPHKTTLIGLNYNAVEVRPGRGLIVELLSADNQLLRSTSTDNNGNYTFIAPGQTRVRVRVKAQLLADQAPVWNVSVRDNTNNNILYAMDGSLTNTGSSDSVRNLHAASGWTGISYGNPRVAAPFAILDSLYTALKRFANSGYVQAFPTLDIFWSINNRTAEGDPKLGEIGTSYYDGTGIYVLGEANSDTDEYDYHVILHEWGHYIENTLSRTDTLGGDHAQNVPQDMRLAMSEGFSTGLAAMMLNNPLYADSLGVRQSDGFYFDASDKNPDVKGWFSEASVSSIIYHYYLSSNNKTARNFADVLAGITADSFIQTEGLVSIFTLSDSIKNQNPAHAATIDILFGEHNIFGTDTFGANESNNGGVADALPVYKALAIDAPAIQICSSNIQGNYNKLGVHQFLRLTVGTNGNYNFSVTKSSGQSIVTDPDVEIFYRGNLVDDGVSSVTDSETFTASLTSGNYVVVVTDRNNHNAALANTRRACFDVRVQSN
jgi:hypothetical protein